MASFSDSSNIQQLTSFNPYIQQQPLEQMVTVGMEKQRRYDEGIQKIQTNIENIAGLDVIRDVDKTYLNSKLNQLGSKLKTVAAGDFSNYQLTNSVGGMVKQIGKDTAVQNAVMSTARYRKSVAEMQQAQKDGKSAPSNDWLFQKDASAWLNSEDVNTSFNSVYKPYTNYKKNALEVIKALTKDQTITDNAFTVDSQGNIVIADAIVRKKLAGISPEKVQQALLAGLTPADFQQMEIDGRYAYSNVSPERFMQKVEQSYKDKEVAFLKQKETIQAAISQTSSNPEKNRLKEQVESLDKMINSLKLEYSSVSSGFAQGDVESAKAKLETLNFMNNFSKAFAYTETSTTIENSPYANLAMERQKLNQSWKEFSARFEQTERKMKQDYDLSMLDIAAKERANDLKAQENMPYGGLPGARNKEDVPEYTLARVVGEVQQGEKQIETLDREFLRFRGKSEAWLQEQEQAWEKNPKGVDPVLAIHFSETAAIRQKIMADKIMITDVEKQAAESINPKTGKPYGYITDLIPRDAPSVTLRTANGTYNYSPKDFVSFNDTYKKYREYVTSSGSIAGTGGTKVYFKDEEAQRDLSPKELILYTALKKREQRKSLSKAEEGLVDNLLNYNEIVNQPYSSVASTINSLTAQEVTRRLTASQSMGYTVPTNTEPQKQSMAGRLLDFAKIAESQNGKLPYSPDFDVDVARKIAIDPNMVVTVNVVEGSEIEPEMYNLSYAGKEGVVNIRMTPEQRQSVFGDRFASSPAIQRAKPFITQINKMGGNSTALSRGESNHTNAFISAPNFPNVNLYGVKANIEKAGDKYSIRVSVYDPITKKWQDNIAYPRTGLISEDKIAEALFGLNDATVYELINDKSATSQDLKKVAEAAKKPF